MSKRESFNATNFSGMSKEKLAEMMRKSWEKLYLTDKELQDTKQNLEDTKRVNENLKILNRSLATQLKEAKENTSVSKNVPSDQSEISIENIVAAMKDLKSEINSLKEESRDRKREINDLKEESNILKREINTLKEEHMDLKREINAIKEDNRDIKREIVTLQEENKDIKREINSLKERSEVIERQKKDLTSEIQTLKERVGAVESDIFFMKHVNILTDIFVRISKMYLNFAYEEAKKSLSQKEWQQIIPLYLEDVTINQIPVSKKDLHEVWEWYLQKKDIRNTIDRHRHQLHENNGLSIVIQQLVDWYYQ
ncbi:hypothetical protein C9374_008211 [Naegleria lovaniensis]|uniref:E3 ubiquitin protein ligase n=1 Tax=Naegleria lovaniensis TaxID=51637 RepID=A0AA88GJL8_NAELO|nr:uncharacterized protein C9374_008211 [Naegleria lovaniensis]KAG2378572.1 hypothetical protein C9374_008211 [Naegleria lovaniensis]